ncbi:MAG TPA: metalloregulator ArsR/SmtB family transcription factor [Anaerolineales bacterium]|jgi:ArsR family transcriptional regulator
MEEMLEHELHELHANLCSGLADPKRLMILYTLAQTEHSVGDLAATLNLPQPTVSRHLKILRERGLVQTERAGTTVIYSLADRRLIEALDLLRAMMGDIFDRRASVVSRAP